MPRTKLGTRLKRSCASADQDSPALVTTFARTISNGSAGTVRPPISTPSDDSSCVSIGFVSIATTRPHLMVFAERELPGDGTLVATFKCPKCDRVVAMLTNPMETQLVSSLGVEIGGRTVPAEPFEMVRANVVTTAGLSWSADAQERLSRVPSFVRGMVKRIYADYARERGITEITPAIMDTARAELGLEGM